MKNYWDLMADQFQHQSQPLRPCAEDIKIMEDAIHTYSQERHSTTIQVLMLGVTPEIATLAWPEGTSLQAVERSSAMIEKVWPGNIQGQREAVCSDWFNLDVDTGSKDIVIGDGFFTPMSFPEQYRVLAQTLSGWLKKDGLFIVRLFLRSPQKETISGILKELRSGHFCAFDALKFRLGKALQPDVATGVVVDDIYRAWLELEKEMPDLVEKAGWPRARVNTIGLYEGRMTRYYFPNLEEVRDVMSPWFEMLSIRQPGYEFGESHPTVVFRPKQQNTSV